MDNRKQYEPPTVAVIGDVEDMTAGTPAKGSNTDAAYPFGTKRSDFRYYNK